MPRRAISLTYAVAGVRENSAVAMKTRAELEAMLTEQVDYLESSAHLYDKRRKYEAKRLAVTIRVLLHDTSMSRSLLQQLDLKHRLLFLDTAGPVNRTNPATLTALLIMRITMGEGGTASGSYEPVFTTVRSLIPGCAHYRSRTGAR